MILSEEYVNFLVKYDLTQEQLLLLILLYENKIDLIRKYKKAFPNDSGKMISNYLINKLIKKGFLVDVKGGYNLGQKFLQIYVTPDKAVDEIYNVYPSFLIKDNGNHIPLITMDKRIFKELYIPKILGSIKEHQKVIEDIKYGVDNDLIKIGINKFLTSEQWKILRKLRQPAPNTINTTHDEDF